MTASPARSRRTRCEVVAVVAVDRRRVVVEALDEHVRGRRTAADAAARAARAVRAVYWNADRSREKTPFVGRAATSSPRSSASWRSSSASSSVSRAGHVDVDVHEQVAAPAAAAARARRGP